MSKLHPYPEISCNWPSNKNRQGEITYRQLNVQLKKRPSDSWPRHKVPSHVRIIPLMVAIMVPPSRCNRTGRPNFLKLLKLLLLKTWMCLFRSFCADLIQMWRTWRLRNIRPNVGDACPCLGHVFGLIQNLLAALVLFWCGQVLLRYSHFSQHRANIHLQPTSWCISTLRQDLRQAACFYYISGTPNHFCSPWNCKEKIEMEKLPYIYIT